MTSLNEKTVTGNTCRRETKIRNAANASVSLGKEDLCETEVLAAGSNGRQDLLTKLLVTFILWEIKF